MSGRIFGFGLVGNGVRENGLFFLDSGSGFGCMVVGGHTVDGRVHRCMAFLRSEYF